MVDVRAQRGSVQFSYRGETQLVPEGVAYRFVLDPSDEGATASAKVSAFPPKHQRKEPQGFVYFFIGATAVVTYIAIDEALESPSKP